MQHEIGSAVTPETMQTYPVHLAGSASLPWFALQTRSNYERVTANLLASKGFECYLPGYKARKRWSDRVVEVERALFPGYLFCRFDAKARMPILTTPGVRSVIGFCGEPAAIEECEIEAIRTVIRSGRGYEPCGYLNEGQRVRVVQGCLEGLEGILIRKKTEWRMVVSVGMLQRSVAVEVDREWIRPV